MQPRISSLRISFSWLDIRKKTCESNMSFTFYSFSYSSSVSETKRLLSALEYLDSNNDERALRGL